MTYQGPDRKYPRKTFATGSDEAPNVVKEELLQIPDYIDYSVFSKKQLRFAEKVFNTKSYNNNENYIRSKNMFVNLKKPQYWNKTNLYVLFKSITIVNLIVKEVISEVIIMKKDFNGFMNNILDQTNALIDRAITYFNIEDKLNLEKNKDTITFIQNLGSFDTVSALFFNQAIDNQRINVGFVNPYAMGIYLATYAKVVSILTYVNPYVLVRKDSGIDTIKAPVSSPGAVSLPEGERLTLDYKSPYEKFNYNNNKNYVMTGQIESQKLKNLNPHVTKETGTATSKNKTYSKNPVIRLMHWPLYSLNILFPLTIAPKILNEDGNRGANFFNITAGIAGNVKIICSILGISFNTILSRLYFYNQNNKNRIKGSYSIKKDVNNEHKMNVKVKEISSKVNVNYLDQILSYCPDHPIFNCYITEIKAEQGGYNHSLSIEHRISTLKPDQDVLQEATKKQIVTNEDYGDTMDKNKIYPLNELKEEDDDDEEMEEDEE